MGMAPTERLKLRRQMAAAGKKESVSLSILLEVNDCEELSTVPTLGWAEGTWMGKLVQRAESWEEADLSVSDVEASERTCRSCLCARPVI